MKYFHLRYRWADLVSDDNPDGVGGNGGITIGIRNGHDDPNVVEYAVAICNLVDNFCRKTGRHIVDGRFMSEVYRRMTFDSTVTDSDRLTAILDVVKTKAIEKITDDLEVAELYWEALN